MQRRVLPARMALSLPVAAGASRVNIRRDSFRCRKSSEKMNNMRSRAGVRASAGAPETQTSEAETSAAFDDPLAEQFKDMYPAGEGKQITWGVFKTDVQTPDKPDGSGKMSFAEFAEATADEREVLRETAAKELTNIDAAERSRRYKAGAAAGVAAVLLGAFQISTGAPPASRAIMALPLFFALGFVGSGATGL